MISRRILQSYCWNLYLRRSAILNARLSISLKNNAYKNQRLENACLVHARGMAGHSKWANIKHTKEAKDNARSLMFTKMARNIKIAIDMGKSSNPKVNDFLADAIEEAKRNQMPIVKIESIVKGIVDKPLVNFLMETRGPGGCFMIIDIQTDNLSRTKHNLKYEFNRIGTILSECSVQHAFDYKGIIQVDPKASGITIDNAVDVAIEVGAEDVTETAADDDTKVLQFLCDPKEHYSVRKELVNRGCEVVSSNLCYLPKHKIPLGEAEMTAMENLMAVLNERSDIVAVYDNIE